MPAHIVWALSSLADLTGIVSVISADNPPAAQRVAAQQAATLFSPAAPSR